MNKTNTIFQWGNAVRADWSMDIYIVASWHGSNVTQVSCPRANSYQHGTRGDASYKSLIGRIRIMWMRTTSYQQSQNKYHGRKLQANSGLGSTLYGHTMHLQWMQEWCNDAMPWLSYHLRGRYPFSVLIHRSITRSARAITDSHESVSHMMNNNMSLLWVVYVYIIKV